jgi:Spy/CpxP family protein refolding chaperone
MKKTFLAIAILAIMTAATANAQRGPRPPHRSHHKPHARVDKDRKGDKISQLDKHLNLTPEQKNELQKIESRYGENLKKNRLEHQGLKQAQKKDVLSVLTPEQRQRLAERQSRRKSDRHPHRRG